MCKKPDRGIFEYMIKDAALNPSETVFVDDGASNISIGKEFGFVTLQPANGEDWRENWKSSYNYLGAFLYR